MSTEIKPGDTIVTVQDAPTLLGHALPKGTYGTVIRSGPPIVGPYSVYARFEGNRPGDGRQVRPGDVAVVPATPAPLDPSKVKAGDMVRVLVVTIDSPVYEVSGEAYMLGHALAVGGHVLTGPGVTLTAHQPAPEPEPEWEMTQVAVVTPHGKDDLTTRAIYGEDGNWHNAYGGVWSSDGVSVRPLVVIDPAAVDVDALAEALRRVWSGKDFGVTFSWDAIARTLLAELGIEATS